MALRNYLKNEKLSITRKRREKIIGNKSFTVWFTGLSGSGKSTIANLLEIKLHKRKFITYILDGDNIRLGINKDLDFTNEGRKENVRRIAELARLMNEAGIIVLVSVISPSRLDRLMAKKIIGARHFIEVYVDTPLDVCIDRDKKGLYEKALRGEIKNFTGIGSSYEAPKTPQIHIDTEKASLTGGMEEVYRYIHNYLF